MYIQHSFLQAQICHIENKANEENNGKKSTDEVTKNNDDIDLSTNKRKSKTIDNKLNNEISNIQLIKTYTEQNNREPSVEEIYDNLEDQVNKKYIDKFVERLNIKIDKEQGTKKK